MLEIGFSRQKNAGTGIAKILTNMSIAAICYWAVGFALAFGSADVLGISSSILGSNGFFLQFSGNGATAFPVMGVSDATVEVKWLFQFAFCAVSLAIVWGSTLERIKYSAYVIYAIVFASLIYPIGSHWVFGGGWLQNGDTALLPDRHAGLRRLHGGAPDRRHRRIRGPAPARPAQGQVRPGRQAAGDPRALDADGRPRHPDPVRGLVRLQRGSTLGIGDVRMAEVAVVTVLGCAGGIIGAFVGDADQAADDRHRHGRQRRDRGARRDHRAVRLRRGVGGPDHRFRRRHDRGVRRDLDRQADRRPGRRDCRRTAWQASGAPSPAASSPRRGSPSTTPSEIPTAASSTRASSPS